MRLSNAPKAGLGPVCAAFTATAYLCIRNETSKGYAHRLTRTRKYNTKKAGETKEPGKACVYFNSDKSCCGTELAWERAATPACIRICALVKLAACCARFASRI